jgi:hypothetical protein
MIAHWRTPLFAAGLMFLIYIALDWVAMRLGWVHRIGWLGAVIAAVIVAAFSYRRIVRRSGVAKQAA